MMASQKRTSLNTDSSLFSNIDWCLDLKVLAWARSGFKIIVYDIENYTGTYSLLKERNTDHYDSQ